MKQSTKLLSLVLALVLAFGCFSVIGNAALVKSEVAWDNIDDAKLTAEQVADLALDMVDADVLADIEPMDLSILGTLDLSSVDKAFASICDLRDSFWWTIGNGLLNDIGDLDFKPLAKSGDFGKPYKRSDGDLKIVEQLLEFIGTNTNAEILSKAAYGIGTKNGVDLGLIESFLDLGEVGDILANIPGYLVELAYDELVFGSYGYPDDVEDLKKAGSSLPEDVNTLDKVANQAIVGLLSSPQDYDWVPNSEGVKEKVWNPDSVVFPSIAEYSKADIAGYFNINDANNGLFTLIDKLAPFAIYDLGVGALNNNLKKELMEAVDVDFDEVDATTLPTAVAEAFEVDAEDGKESYVTYIAHDKIMQSGSDWYYTTLKTRTVVDANGDPVLDDDGKEQSKKTRVFYKANTAGANDFYSLIDFGWEFVAPKPLTEEEDSADFALDNLSVINYKALIDEYGSITESLNHLLYVVFETALKEDVKTDFETLTGAAWEDGATSDVFMDNAERLLKYLLSEYADKIFGRSSPYVAWEYSDVEDKSIIEIIAIIGPVFFEDAMPQLVMPKNADGTYAFHDGVQILEFGAVVIREFITEIAPNVNYDSYIFAEGNVRSANDRQFATHTDEEWFNIILNMGLDIAYTYLNNITNFNTAIPAKGIDEARWKDMLNAVIMWCANYVGSGNASIIHGFEPNTIATYSDPLDKLSYILNTLLPLGFINGCTTEAFDFDVSVVFGKLKNLLTTFDLTNVVSLFGRNADSTRNIFDENLITVIFTLVNDIVNLILPISENGDSVSNLIQAENAMSIDAAVTQANLKITVKQLLKALNTQKTDLLNCALPVLSMFIEGWGTEQEFKTPSISLSDSISLTNGATSADVTVNVRNRAEGVWRHYRDAAGNEYTDEQYQIIMTGVAAYNFDGSASSYVTIKSFTNTNIDYGAPGTFVYSVTGVPTTGAAVRFDVKYKVIDEDGQEMANGKEFVIRSYAWLNYNKTDANTVVINNENDAEVEAYTPQYVGLTAAADDPETYFGNLNTSGVYRKGETSGADQTVAVSNNTGVVDGLNFSDYSVKLSKPSSGGLFGSADKYRAKVRNFATYKQDVTSDNDGSTKATIDVKGSVDAAAWLAADKKPGSETKINISLKNTTKKTDKKYDFVLKYYDDTSFNNLASLAGKEMSNVRMDADYNATGYYYANRILTSSNSKNDKGEDVIRESNFSDVVWILADDTGYSATGVTEYPGSQVTVTGTDSDGVETEGTVLVNGVEKEVIKVTKINCATAVSTYKAAFLQGMHSGKQVWNANSIYTQTEDYIALRVAVNDMNYCKKSAAQIVAEGNGDNIDAAVDTLKANLVSLGEEYSDNKDYTDYKMYRWNRYTDARKAGDKLVNLKNDASNNSVQEIDEEFPYTSIKEDDLRALVNGDKYSTYILALLEKMDEEEIEETKKWLENKKTEYGSKTLLDVEMADSYLGRTAERLLAREHGVITTYLADEIASANAMVGAQSQYTARSWAKYSEALAAANEVLSNPTQMSVFDAKYELLVARNRLVKVDDEADYSELEALIAQAQQVMANTSLYNNTNKEIGQVLAELGYDRLVNADGDEVELFPGSALLVNEEPYSTDDQKKVDRAATALKEALARLKFKGVNISGGNVKTETIVPADINKGTDAVTASVARIAPELNADAVKNLFSATATSANVTKDLITVSEDVNYTIDTDLDGFAGTNSTVTFYTLVGGVKVPVATVKVVVEADVNGDGVLDVLDGALTELVSNEHARLNGCYFIAANLDVASEGIVTTDYSAVVNKILA